MSGIVEEFDPRVCVLGEAPHYDARTRRVRWVDILGRRVLWRTVAGRDDRAPDAATGDRAPDTGTGDRAPDTGEFSTGADVGAAVPTISGGLVLCLPDRLVLRERSGRERDLVAYPVVPGTPLRSNDAKADPAGRLWHGTMAYDSAPGRGALYRLDPGAHQTRRILDGVTISNGLGWSPDGRTMYYADSATGRVDAFDYDPGTGTPSRRRPFAGIAPGNGVPDGLTVDAAGGVWIALWGGSAVRRYRPDGVAERTVRLPTPQVTACAFAGPELDLLVITTAAERRPGDAAAGRTYAYRPGDVTGLPCDRFAD